LKQEETLLLLDTVHLIHGQQYG